MASTVLKTKPGVEDVDTGIDNRRKIATSLSGIVADNIVLLVKTQGYHWNVVGPLFHSIHELTEAQYKDLFAAIDTLAERIRALGYPAPTSLKSMISETRLDDAKGNPSAEKMIETLVADHEAVVRAMREAAEMAEEQHDLVTADLLTARMGWHEQAIWMLRAIIS